MPTTSHFDHGRRIQFFGGPWDGCPYTPMRGAAYPQQLHMAWHGQLHRYVIGQVDGRVVLRHVQTCLPDGAEVK